MNLSEYGLVLRRRGWIVLLVALVTGLSAAIFAELQRPTYRSRAVLQVIPSRPGDYGNALAADQMLRVLSFQATTTEMAREVATELELDVPPRRLLSFIHTSSEADGLRIMIEADWPDPILAQRISQSFAESFVDKWAARSAQADSRDRLDVDILEPAPEGWVHWPRTKPLAAAGLLFGALAGAAVVLGLELLSAGYIRSTADVERSLEVAVLGTIPPLERAAANRPGRRWGRA